MNNKQLYENIMSRVSIQLKKAINEAIECDEPEISFNEEDYLAIAKSIRNQLLKGYVDGDVEYQHEYADFVINWKLDQECKNIEIEGLSKLWFDRDGGDEETEMNTTFIDSETLTHRVKGLMKLKNEMKFPILQSIF